MVSGVGPQWLGWLLPFLGLALHYIRGLIIGRLSSSLFLRGRPWTFQRDESPILFMIAAIVEGVFVMILFLVMLASF
jgi:hypothetical protein